MVNRNRTMKDSKVKWIGGIPDNWEVKPLKYIANIQTGNTPSMKNKHYYSDNGIDWVKTNNLLGTKGVKESEVKLSIEGSKVARIAKAHSTLVSCIGDVGKMGYITLDSAYNQQINAVTFNEDDVFWKYGMYYISVQKEQHQYYQNGNVLKILNTENQKRVVVPVPKIEEQKKIAAFLDEKVSHIDNIIEDTKKSIENLKVYKQSLITETVTKGLSPDVETKDSGVEWFGRIPSHWMVSKVGNVFEVILGKMLSTFPKESNWTEERYLSAINVHFEGVETFNLKKMWFSPVEKEKLEVKFGDLLVVEGGAGAGGSALYLSEEKGIYVQNSINIVRPKANLSNTSFAYYIFYCLVKNGYVDYVSNKATIPHFTKEKVQSVPYPIIPSNEQQVIVEFLDERTKQVDSLIDQKEQLINELESYKKSFIYEYVTGKKEVM